jgi:hypothetical protein
LKAGVNLVQISAERALLRRQSKAGYSFPIQLLPFVLEILALAYEIAHARIQRGQPRAKAGN